MQRRERLNSKNFEFESSISTQELEKKISEEFKEKEKELKIEKKESSASFAE
jgi:hypothetical protein